MSRRIPITVGEHFHFDDEKNGVRYFVKPKTGKTSMIFTVICSDMSNASNIEKVEGICSIVDLFLVDVQPIGKGQRFPKKPDGVKFSDVLDEDAILFVYYAILKESGLLIEEKKSSSQPQTSYSEPTNTGNSTIAADVNTGTKSAMAAKSKRKK